jgi:fumarate reductase (CoM/CoB) subunit B
MPDLETSLSYCTYCPKLCRHVCPVSNAEAKETLVPQTKMATLRVLRHEARRDEDSFAPIYGCTGCGACTDVCLHKVAVGASLFQGREQAEREGRGHPALADFPRRFDAHSKKAQAEIRARVPAARRPLEAQVVFLAGCEAPELAATMVQLCDRIGAEYVGIADGDDACGGYPLLAAGHLDAFRMHAERVARQHAGSARLVVHCPACAFVMRTQYRNFGVPLHPTVEHTSEFLEGFAERLPVTARRERAFYHDPCYLGRHLGLYDPPRRLAGKAVGDLREFSRARNQSECSGGGGLLPLTMPAAADAIAEHRLEEVREAQVREVVTACATCKRRLSRGDVKAVDLIELLETATR